VTTEKVIKLAMNGRATSEDSRLTV